MKKISVIIPVYNGEKYLVRCIESLLKQTYKNTEFIFLNDGSQDKSLSILEEYQKKDKRIVIIDKPNSGVSDTRNIGISKAKGDYICFCDCDDLYEENYLEIMYDLITKEKVDVVKCNYQVIDINNQVIDTGNLYDLGDKKYDHNAIVKEIVPKLLNGEVPCFCYLMMIKKEVIKNHFPTAVAMMEDVVFYLELLLNIKSMYITNHSLYTIMFNPEGATNNVKNYQRNILNVIAVNSYLKNELKRNRLADDYLIECTNLNSLNSISDFIFRHYLYSKENTIKMCQRIRTNEYVGLIEETDLNKLNIQRRMILKLIYEKKYRLLKIFLISRKIVFKLRRI